MRKRKIWTLLGTEPSPLASEADFLPNTPKFLPGASFVFVAFASLLKEQKSDCNSWATLV